MNEFDQNRLNENPAIEPYYGDIPAEAANRAYHNTSQFPERAGSLIRSDYAVTLIQDRNEVESTVRHAVARGAELAENADDAINEWFSDHRAGLKAKYLTYLHSHSNVASSFICGPANFPSARMQKRSQWADNHYQAIGAFRATSKKRILKRLLPYGDGTSIQTHDPQAVKKVDSKREALERQRDLMKACNKAYRKHYKKDAKPEPGTEAYTACIADLQACGLSEAQAMTAIKPNYMGRCIPFETWELSNLGAEIRRLASREQEIEASQSAELDDSFPNGETATISDDGKIVIDFGYKPDEETRAVLKRHAFKWSRARMAWVRKVTQNALRDYQYYIKPLFS